MNVAVDGSSWGGQERGVAVSTRRLWSALLRGPHAPRTVAFAPSALATQLSPANVVPVGPLTGAARVAWQHVALPRLVRRHGVEVLHCPCYTAPLAPRCRTVVTVHDLIAWSHPRLAGWRNASHLRLLVGRAVRRAAAICTPTHVVARQLVARFDVDPAKVFVVPWGTDDELAPVESSRAAALVEQRFDVRRPYALWCGCVEPKKNVAAAVHAAARAGLVLLMVGPWIAASRRILAGLPRGAYRYLGYVSAGELSALYAAATALLVTSHVEGFGMPAVEAMRLGCPVIAVDTPVFREVCGTAARFAPPDDPDQAGAALRDIAASPALHRELVARGRDHAAQLTWTRAAQRFTDALQHAAR